MLYPLLGFKDAAFPAGIGWHDRIQLGVPRLALWGLARALQVPVAEVATLVGVPLTELVWKERKELLSRDVSAQLYRIAVALHRLYVVLPTPAVAAAWLKVPRKELDGAVPIRLLLTQPGSDTVFAVITRIASATSLPKVTRNAPEPEVVSDSADEVSPDLAESASPPF